MKRASKQTRSSKRQIIEPPRGCDALQASVNSCPEHCGSSKRQIIEPPRGCDALLALINSCPEHCGPWGSWVLMDIRLLCRSLWKAWHDNWKSMYPRSKQLMDS